MRQEVVLAMLAKEPSHGYELRARLARALGPVAEGINEAQMYVTLARLEKGGFVARLDAPAQRSDRKVYCLTPAGQERVTEWMSEVSWPRPDLAEFHMKLVAAAQGGLADPISLIDAQRRDLLRRLREVGRAVMGEEKDSDAALLLEGIVLRLQADLRDRLDETEYPEMNDSPTVLVHARGLRKDYGSGEGLVRALDGVDLDVNRGEAVAVMGPSGCGKSTLLHLIGGLDRPSAGQLSVAGKRVDELSERALAYLRRDEIGFIFQSFQLMDELTAQENVELPALLAGHSPNEARARATALLEQVGLADRARHLPSMLSGGQRQRVAIARALVNDPGIVLADEPTGNLDSASAFDVLSLLGDLHAQGLTLVIVTHDERIAATADRLISMRDGAFVDETRLTGGSRGNLSTFAEWEHLR
jgi:putative ABC transport system ATP-binding protein